MKNVSTEQLRHEKSLLGLSEDRPMAKARISEIDEELRQRNRKEFQVNDLVHLQDRTVSRITKITDTRIELEGSHSSASIYLEDDLQRAPLRVGVTVRLIKGSPGNFWLVSSLLEGDSVKLRAQTLGRGDGGGGCFFAPRYLEVNRASVAPVACRETILNDLVIQSRAQAAKTLQVPTAPSLSAEVEKEKTKALSRYKHDFANLPTEYDLQGHLCMMTDPRFSYLLENLSFWIDYEPNYEAEDRLKSGEAVGSIHKEPHALKVHIQGFGSKFDNAVKEFQDLLVQFLIPSVYMGRGVFLLEPKWDTAR